MEERLQKFLARAGVASRRAAEELIRQGAVLVNGERVPLGTSVDGSRDVVTCRGQVVQAAEQKIYLMLHKPTGVLTTASDDRGRPTVLDLVHTAGERLYPVGRLDLDTSGLLLLTNDGDFAYALTHPKLKVPKKYRALVEGMVTEPELLALQRGVDLGDGVTSPAEVEVLAQSPSQTLLQVVIHEGRKRQVRRMCAVVGHPVLELKRVQLGSLILGDLPPGKTRQLAAGEVQALLAQASSAPGTKENRQ